MKRLIDGYNLMHAVVLLPGQKLGKDGLRRARNAFLTRLADRLGAFEASQTTVVFDAAEPLANLPRNTTHKGLSVLFASEAVDADEEIEKLIAAHPAPRKLTVVSSDRRLQVAAARKKASFIDADTFWDRLQHPSQQAHEARPPAPASRERQTPPADRDFWAQAFEEVEQMPELKSLREQQAETLLTDAEIARIQREVDHEFGGKNGR